MNRKGLSNDKIVSYQNVNDVNETNLWIKKSQENVWVPFFKAFIKKVQIKVRKNITLCICI